MRSVIIRDVTVHFRLRVASARGRTLIKYLAKYGCQINNFQRTESAFTQLCEPRLHVSKKMYYEMYLKRHFFWYIK